MTEAEDIITNINCIVDAHKYLCKLDKQKFTIEYFIKEFERGVLMALDD